MKIFEILQYTTIILLGYLQLKNCMQFIDQTNESFQQTLSNIFEEKNIKRIRNIMVKIYLMGKDDSYKDEIIECTLEKNDEEVPVYAFLIHQARFNGIFNWTDAQTNINYEFKLNINDTGQLTRFYQKKTLNVLDFLGLMNFTV